MYPLDFFHKPKSLFFSNFLMCKNIIFRHCLALSCCTLLEGKFPALVSHLTRGLLVAPTIYKTICLGSSRPNFAKAVINPQVLHDNEHQNVFQMA